jgi:hypothetical protein
MTLSVGRRGLVGILRQPQDSEARSTLQKHFGELDPQFVIEARGPDARTFVGVGFQRPRWGDCDSSESRCRLAWRSFRQGSVCATG